MKASVTDRAILEAGREEGDRNVSRTLPKVKPVYRDPCLHETRETPSNSRVDAGQPPA